MTKQGSKRRTPARPKRRNVDSSDQTTDSHERRKDYLKEKEVEELRKAARNGRHAARDDALILVIFRHGLRVSEAAEMRLDDLDLEGARMWVGRLKGSLSTEQPIEGDELRTIKRYLATREDDLPWLFVNERGGQMTREGIYKLIVRLAARADLGHVHPHMLRHACGYHLTKQTKNARVIQDYLGHRNPRHTVRYTRVDSKEFVGLFSKRGK